MEAKYRSHKGGIGVLGSCLLSSYVNTRASNERAGVRGQEQDELCHLFWLTKSAQGSQLDVGLSQVALDEICHGRLDEVGQD